MICRLNLSDLLLVASDTLLVVLESPSLALLTLLATASGVNALTAVLGSLSERAYPAALTDSPNLLAVPLALFTLLATASGVNALTAVLGSPY